MKEYIPLLLNTKLFEGIHEYEIYSMLDCLQANIKTYKKGTYIFKQGDFINNITILLKGKLLIQKDDYWGNRSIINVIRTGEMFGESFMATKDTGITNDVIADIDSTVIFFDINKLITLCPNTCTFHSRIIQNLFFVLSEKNRKLIQKLGHLAKRSTREKLISYLSEEAKHHHSNNFAIPFNRQQLADFLSVDRSAMSYELCKMRDEGLLQFNKNNFKLN